jgi:hypothetical protein
MSVKKYSIKTIFSQCKSVTNMCGFLLIEIVSAMALFSFSVLMAAKFCGQIYMWQREAQMYAMATTSITQMIEKIKIEKVLPAFRTEKNEMIITCLPWGQSITPEAQVSNMSFLKKFEWIEIRASWKTARHTTQTLLVYTGVELR